MENVYQDNVRIHDEIVMYGQVATHKHKVMGTQRTMFATIGIQRLYVIEIVLEEVESFIPYSFVSSQRLISSSSGCVGFLLFNTDVIHF